MLFSPEMSMWVVIPQKISPFIDRALNLWLPLLPLPLSLGGQS